MRNCGTVYLSGGGDENKTIVLDAHFLSCLSEKNILFIPIAKNADMNGYKKSLGWIRKKLSNLTSDPVNVSMALNLSKYRNLNEYSAVYIGGGNTYKLLHMMQGSGFLEILKKYLIAGGVVYGASAGAVLMGKDISICIEDKYIEENKKFGYAETKGIGLLGECSIVAHFHKDDTWKIMRYLKTNESPVVAIPEGAAVIVHGESISSIGKPSIIFNQNGESSKIGLYPNTSFW